METVKVVVSIPGLLEKGDILVSEGEGKDFKMFVKGNNFERSATIDYRSVCENIPTYFDWEIDEADLFVEEPIHRFEVVRSEKEVEERYEFFKEQIEKNNIRQPADYTFLDTVYEKNVVYNNLVWFIDWLRGETELLK